MSSSARANFFKGAGTRHKLATRSQTPPETTSPTVTPERNPPPTKSKMDDVKNSNERNEDSSICEEIRKMSATLQVVAADVVSIKETTKELRDAVDNMQTRLGDVEQRISDIEDVNARMEKGMEKCDKRLETLWTRVEDLENRSRRNNVRLVGLKEGKEETGKVIQYVERIISEGLGFTGNEFEILGFANRTRGLLCGSARTCLQISPRKTGPQ